MGQRHQAFIIARVLGLPGGNASNKAFYRCLGGWHHQWCYGSLPLQAVRRFMGLIRNPENAAIVREEVKSLQGKYGGGNEGPEIPDMPCPYTSFLLASSFNVDLTQSYCEGGYFDGNFLPADSGCFDMWNDDGITVIDVTDPSNPAYCFSVRHSSTKIMNAQQYLSLYYEVQPTEEELKDEEMTPFFEVLDELREYFTKEDLRIISAKTLCEVWKADFEDAKILAQSADPSLASTTTIPPLADLAVVPAIRRGLEVGELEEIEALIWMPGKAALIREALRSFNSLPDSSLSLLTTLLKHDSTRSTVNNGLDLSRFPLSSTQLLRLLSSVCVGDDTIDVLNLSHSRATIEAVRTALTINPKITRLVLLDTSISDDEITSLITQEPKLFLHVGDVTHDVFVSGVSPEPHANGFSTLVAAPGATMVYVHEPCFPYLPVWTPAKVIQAVADLMSAIDPMDPISASKIVESMATQVAFSSSPRKEGQAWSERTVSMIASHMSASQAPIGCGGWGFVYFHYDSFGFRIRADIGPQFGFFKVDPVNKVKEDVQPDGEGQHSGGKAVPSFVVYDVKGFLAEMEKEGRPLPTQTSIDEVEEVLSKLEETMGITLITAEALSGLLIG